MIAGCTLLVAFGSPVVAMAAPVTENSVKELMAVTQTQKLLDGVRGQFDALMESAIQQNLNGKTPNAKQQQAIDNMKKKMGAVMRGEMAWDKFEPMYLRVYQDAFTEEELNGMLAFY